MEKFEKKADSGALMATMSKKDERSPDYWGEIAINPKDLTAVTVENGLHVYKISGWKKTSKSGSTYLSVAINRWVPEGSARPASQEAEDEDVPF